MDVGKKGTQIVKNKKILSLAFAMLFGGFQIINAAHVAEAPVLESGRPSVEPVRPRDTNPARWDLLQRLQHDTAPKLGYVEPAGKPGKGTASADVVISPVVSKPTGVVADSASLKALGVSKGTLARIVEVGEGDHDFTRPDALFLQNGTMLLKMLDGKQQELTDPFLVKIREKMKDQRETYQGLFSRLTPKQKEQEQKSFEILNTELVQLKKLQEDLVALKNLEKNPKTYEERRNKILLKEKAINEVKAGIRKLIKQMNKATFNAVVPKPVVDVEPVDEGYEDEPVRPVISVHEDDEDDGLPASPRPVDKVTPQGRGIGGKTFTAAEEARAEAEIQRVLAEKALRNVQQQAQENGTTLAEPVVAKAMKDALGKSLSGLQAAVEGVLLDDPDISTITGSRAAHSDPQSLDYRVDSKRLVARVKFVAQEAKRIIALVDGSSLESVVADLEAQVESIRSKYERDEQGNIINPDVITSKDEAAFNRLEIDLKVCDFLRDNKSFKTPGQKKQEEAERALEESKLRKAYLQAQGTSLVLPRTAEGLPNAQITAAIEKAFGKLNKDNKEAIRVAESVLLGDSVVTDRAESRVENQDPTSKQYRADSKDLTARIQKVAQETKAVFALVKAGKSVEEVMDDLGRQIRMIKESTRTGFDIKGDVAELDRLKLDLKICEALKQDALSLRQILKPKTNADTLDEQVVDSTIESALGKSSSDLGQMVYDVLDTDSVVSGVTARQVAYSDPRSSQYRAATKDLVARVKLVAQEAKKINAQLVKEGGSVEALAKIKANVELNLSSAIKAGKKDNAVRYQVDLQICEALEKTVVSSSSHVVTTVAEPDSFAELLADAQKDDEVVGDIPPAEVVHSTSGGVEVQPVRSAVKTYKEYLEMVAQEAKTEITDAQRETFSTKTVQSKLKAALKKALKGYKVSKEYAAEFKGKVEDALEKDPAFLKLLTDIKNDTPEQGRQPAALTVDYQLLVARAGKIAKGMQEILYATEETGTVSSLDKLVAMKKILQGRLKHLFDRNQHITDRQNISDTDPEQLDTLEMQLRLCDQLEPVYKEEQEAKEAEEALAARVAQEMATEREKAVQEKAKITGALAKIAALERSGHGQDPEELNRAVGQRSEEILRLLEIAFGPDEKQWSQVPDFKEIESAYRSYMELADQDQGTERSTVDTHIQELELLERKQNVLLAELRIVLEKRLNPSAVVAEAPVRVEPVATVEPVEAPSSHFGIKGSPLALPKAQGRMVHFERLPDENLLDDQDITAGGLHVPVVVEHQEGGEEAPVQTVAPASDAVVRSYTNLNEVQLKELRARSLTQAELGELSRSNLEALKQFYGKHISDLRDERLSFQRETSTDFDVDREDAIEAVRSGLELSEANLVLVERILEKRAPEVVVEPVQSPAAKKGNLLTDFEDEDDDVIFDPHAPRLDSGTPLIVPKASSGPIVQSMYQESTLQGMDTSALEGLQQVLLEDTVALRTKMASDKKAGVDVGELEKSLASSRATYELINKILKELPVTSSGPKPLKKTAPIMIDSAGVVKILLEKTKSEQKGILNEASVEELLLVRAEVEKQLKKPTMQLLAVKDALDEILKSRQVVRFSDFTPTGMHPFFDDVIQSKTYETNINKAFYDGLIKRMTPYQGKNLTVAQKTNLNEINEQCMALETPGADGFKVRNKITTLVNKFMDSFKKNESKA